MFGFRKRKLKKSLKANNLIHDAIIMGIADKYIEIKKLDDADDFGHLLRGRALNWAVPNLNYTFESDLDKVENREIFERLRANENQIFEKGLEILNSDRLIEKLITYYSAYTIFLVNSLFPKDAETRYPGMTRLKKFVFQSSEHELDVHATDFKNTYKRLFIEFNEQYGKYGKILKKETIDTLFSLI